jgi:hypothetical protein
MPPSAIPSRAPAPPMLRTATPGASDILQMQKVGADYRPNDTGHKGNRWEPGG